MKFIFFVFLLFSLDVFAKDIDFKLDKVIEIYNLKGFDCKLVQPFNPSLSSVGEALFETKLLSGNLDTSCSTCHLKNLNRIDGLKMSVGVGGAGEGIDREKDGKGIIVPRNVFTLIGRGHIDYKTYFWDGKVQVEKDRLVSIIGDASFKGFDSPLSIAAILPLLARDEFLGLIELNETNEMEIIDKAYHEQRYEVASTILRNRILVSEGDEWDELRSKLHESNIKIDTLQLSDIGNALAAFLIEKENCVTNKWTEYITGNKDILTVNEKKGAYLFYGKARCSSCHSGDLLSDFKFHSIGVPQGNFGVSVYGQDLGRSEISLNHKDRFKFKTPSLLNVSKTKPYGHNGVFEELDDVVLFHINPIPYFKDKDWTERDYFNYGRVLSSRSDILSYIDVLTEQEFEDLLSFINTL
jgi:cytochrome c peroxidase